VGGATPVLGAAGAILRQALVQVVAQVLADPVGRVKPAGLHRPNSQEGTKGVCGAAMMR